MQSNGVKVAEDVFRWFVLSKRRLVTMDRERRVPAGRIQTDKDAAEYGGAGRWGVGLVDVLVVLGLVLLLPSIKKGCNHATPFTCYKLFNAC